MRRREDRRTGHDKECRKHRTGDPVGPGYWIGPGDPVVYWNLHMIMMMI